MRVSFLLLVCAICCSADYNRYEILDLIGSGASSFVYRVRNTLNHHVYAMKAIRKTYVKKNRSFAQVQSEREILATNRSPFTLRLVESFSDDTFLYLITEFASGGDLMTLMLKYDVLPEKVARFYVAEILLGIQAVHQRSITLRDLKFENILVDHHGHLKLADFGLATFSVENRYNSEDFVDEFQLDNLRSMRRLSGTISRSTSRAKRPSLGSHKRSQTSVPRLESKQVNHKRNRGKDYQQESKFHSVLGSLDYTAYELWNAKGYTSACDLWSLGVILFEMLQGYPVFVAETPQETVHKIRNYEFYLEKALADPDAIPMSKEAINLIQKLLCKEEQRLSINDVIKHSFFLPSGTTAELDQWWSCIRTQQWTPPFVPLTATEYHADNFPEEELRTAENQDEEETVQSLWQRRKGTIMEDIEQVFAKFQYIGFQ